MKIYSIYYGKVHFLDVVETKKQYKSHDWSSLAFGCKKTFKKTDYETTAVKAIQREIIRKYNQRDFFIGKCEQLKTDIESLDGLLVATREEEP